MYNFSKNPYEMKREIVNFSKKIYEGCSKPTSKFVLDMQYGLAKSGSCLISEIARALDENIKLPNTIERLCDNLVNLTEQEEKMLWENYRNEISNQFPEIPISLFDDSDASKRFGKKFEDLDDVIDASSPNKEIVPGYHICEAVILGKEEKQPISVYSKIYSCKSADFISKNNYTLESIEAVKNVLNRKFIGVFDRGYDDNKIIDYMDYIKSWFVIRMNDRRNFLFKGKVKNAYKEALKRKGKINMELWFEDEKVEISVSHTKATLPYNKKDYELVFVYGLSEERPLILLTSLDIHSKEDVIKIVRLYFYRWRVEEYFRAKKQEYDFENFRVRTLKAINILNMLLTIHIGHMGLLAEKLDKKILSIKIIEASKSLKRKIIVWLSQMARGIKTMLSNARQGIKEWQEIEQRSSYRQLQLKL